MACQHEGQGAHEQLRVWGHSDRLRPDEGVDQPGPAPCPGRAAQPMERGPRGRPPVSRDQRADRPTALVTECCGAPRLRRTWACVHEWDAFREGRVTCASDGSKPEYWSDAVTARLSDTAQLIYIGLGTWLTTPAISSGMWSHSGYLRPYQTPRHRVRRIEKVAAELVAAGRLRCSPVATPSSRHYRSTIVSVGRGSAS